jgi:NAD(P)H-hydrate epimerase
MDKQATDEYGIPPEILMENAGEAVYTVIQKESGIEGKKFAVLCGPGNNGGDGFVVARKLHSRGGEVKVFLLADRTKYQGAAKKNLEIIERFPITIKEITSVRQIKKNVAETDAIVDALLGTGLDRDVTGLLCQVIEAVNASGKRSLRSISPPGLTAITAGKWALPSRQTPPSPSVCRNWVIFSIPVTAAAGNYTYRTSPSRNLFMNRCRLK